VLALVQPAAHDDVALEETRRDDGRREAVAIRPKAAPTLENFLVGDSNRIAFGLARRLAMGGGVEANVVTIVGPHGVGKIAPAERHPCTRSAAKGESSVLYMSLGRFHGRLRRWRET
jgi:hypothetical protein